MTECVVGVEMREKGRLQVPDLERGDAGSKSGSPAPYDAHAEIHQVGSAVYDDDRGRAEAIGACHWRPGAEHHHACAGAPLTGCLGLEMSAE